MYSLSPKYDELGELFKPFSDKVVIAKVDATLNDVPDEIQGFPTIKLYAAGKKDSPIAYSGARTVEDLAAFIKDNGSHGIDSSSAKKSEKVASDMPKQAPAATEKAEEAAAEATGGVKGAIKEAAEMAKEALGDEESVDERDEL
jgi:protein disulfide-isomerase A1